MENPFKVNVILSKVGNKIYKAEWDHEYGCIQVQEFYAENIEKAIENVHRNLQPAQIKITIKTTNLFGVEIPLT